ncbi:flagellar hook-associated protein FlgK [Rhodopirellula sp. JC740]|uniref:Flagellar hook-associated protein 1 n=1 Tax=Rhodopirellula halodulae TaxID=2894198 RepID=A0ABS8NJ26_9BACT|nr:MULTISPECIES: flagellar hook-associated protein FlgK [unclassified Rhodopirellula]MCC9643559.1 flagellar hook-associated protein FlgK [Rhodopirellula sp. JC740]MCC9654253.1 flagellar hook-associated protein FlgK [Rhodopirellula sp. JC737]
MGLFGTIQQSKGALDVAQIGLQVVGNNIANANTDGYIRQRLEQTPAVAYRRGSLIQGHGVRATGVKQVIDQQLAERMFNAKTGAAGADALSEAYTQLETLISDLDGGGLNEQFSLFNNALHDLSTQPNDSATREFVIIQGQALANHMQQIRTRAGQMQDNWNAEMDDAATQINRLTERIAQLNVEIATIEGGGTLGSDATGLRDQRYRDLEELASYVDINFQEQASGNVSVFVGGDYLVADGNRREVYAAFDEDAGGLEVRILETDAPLQVSGGSLGAAIEARNGIFGEYVKDLDQMASSLIEGVNRVHSQGQGRTGFSSVVSSNPSEAGVPLGDAGLPFEPNNGSFDFNIVDADGELISTTRIDVGNLGTVNDSTISSIVADINAVDGVTASISGDGRIRIDSDSPTANFTFGEDTSGFLAAVGLNTFFTGSSAVDIEVNPVVRENIDLLAISSGGINQDTNTLYEMLDLVDKPLESLDNRSIRGLHEQTLAALGREISVQKSATEGLNDLYASLQSQHLAITGVNIDEESIKMISYQRAFQASSRVISTAAEMLDILLAI